MRTIPILRARYAVLVALLTVLLVPALVRPGRALAHSQLVQSDPPAQSVLTKAPARVQLSYSEAVDPKSIELSVLNAERTGVDNGDAGMLAGTDDTITISLKDGLSDGVYTMQWKVTSAVDGHTTRGLVPFTVGDPGAVPAAGTAETAGVDASSGGWTGVFARWLAVLAAVAVTGSFLFAPLVLGPALRLLDDQVPASDRTRNANGRKDSARAQTPSADEAPKAEAVARVGDVALDRLLTITRWLLLLFAAGTLLVLAVEVSLWRDGGWSSVFGKTTWNWLTETRRGTLWAVRAGLIVAMGVWLATLSRRVRADGRKQLVRPWMWVAGAALGAAALLTLSLGSHTAAVRSVEGISVAIDWLHLLAVAVWIGGLIQFGLALMPALGPLGGPPRTRLLAGLIPRFSRVAGASVAVIVVSGIYQTFRLIGGLSHLTDQAWGKALIVKLLLFGLLMLLAGFNLRVVTPWMQRLATRTDRPGREVAARVRTHFRRALMSEVLIAAGVLLVTGFLVGQSPAKVKGFDPGGPFRPFILITNAEGLSGRLVLSPGRIGLNRYDLSVTDTAGKPMPNGTEVVLRLSTLDQDTGVSEDKMQAIGGGRYSATNSLLSTIGLWDISALVRRPGVDEVRLSYQMSLTDVTGAAQVRDNTPAAPLERGREIYQANCAQCHGAGARGDGPLAAALQPRPLDLTVHVPQHTDKELRNWIENGIARTAMPAWSDKFTTEEIQAIINYLRQTAEQAQSDR